MDERQKQAEELRKKALDFHRHYRGKLEVKSRVSVATKEDLSLAYTPGVAEPCKEIHRDPDMVYEYTNKGNLVAVVTDGTAVLGLGDIGPQAAYPVMEGKCVLFKCFGGVDAMPLCVDTKDPDEIVRLVSLLEPTFGGINLEDISAPRCFTIEAELKKRTGMAIFHDDQHGTAIITLAALLNALKVVGKKPGEIRVVFNGAGAAGIATAKLFMKMGVEDIILCDSRGPIWEGRPEGMNPEKEEMARITNRDKVSGTLADALKGAHVFIGLSVAGAVTIDMVKSMADGAMIFAMANPVPEIYPEDAEAGGAAVIATGRSDFPNQINNVLAFPGVLAGALAVRSTDITDEMKIAAAEAIAGLVSPNELNPGYILPLPMDDRVAPAVAAAVAATAMKQGVARIQVSPEEVSRGVRQRVEKVRREMNA